MPSLPEWLGIYGAILSTGLALYQLVKDRRKLVLGFHFGDDDTVNFLVVNVGQLPVTLAGITMFRYIIDGKKRYWDSWEDFKLFARMEDLMGLPKTLVQGEPFKVELEETIWSECRELKVKKVKFMAWDVEGRRYTKVEIMNPPRPAPHLR